MTKNFDDDFLKKLRQLLGDDRHEYKHEHYKKSVELADEMSWHVYGKKPEALLKRTRPREDPEITKYRLESYEPITQSICKKGISILHKVFNSKLYSIRFDDDQKSEELKMYTLENYPRFNSIVTYLSSYSLKKMIADPNGLFLVQPYDYSIKGNERVSPIVTCYGSKDIYLIKDDYILFFDKYNEKEKETYFTYVDKTIVKKFSTIQNGQALSINEINEYAHNFDEIPVWSLGGEYSDKEYGLFESYFSAAVPFWNEAINDHSDVSGAYRQHMWPQKWEVADECDYVDGKNQCEGGWVYNSDRNDRHTCPSCNGAGRKSIKSPYQTYWVNRDKFAAQDGTANVDVPFGYVNVPVEATKMLEEKANRNLEMGLNALAMDVVNQIGENQSGIAKEIDRTELNDFLQKIADQFFEIHLTNIYYYFVKYMFVDINPVEVRKLEPEISKPTQFDIYSTTELTKQFAEAKTAKLNPSYLSTKQAEIQNREFQTNPELLSRLNLELYLDPIAEVTRDEVSLMLANATITKETAIIHDNIKMFIQRAFEEDKNFANKKPGEQKATLDKYAKEVISATKIKIDTNAIQPPIE